MIKGFCPSFINQRGATAFSLLLLLLKDESITFFNNGTRCTQKLIIPTEKYGRLGP